MKQKRKRRKPSTYVVQPHHISYEPEVVVPVFKANFQVWAGSGRKCPDCTVRTMNSHDYAAHRKVCDAKDRKMGWRKNDDGSWWCSSAADLQLKLACLQNGRVVLNGWEITLSDNQKWFRRAPLNIQV